MSLPSSPAGGGQPLQPVSHNAHRERLFGSPSHRDSSVHDKITQFNTLSLQSKSADAALKRAMLGREEAEAEMRRYREEAKKLNRLLEEWKGEVEESKRQIKESKVRETKVSQRLEEYMLWENEVRRTRKETFKVQSSLVKAREELKASRTAQKAAEEELEAERERGKAREQETFDAQYNLVGLQEQLDQALARAKMLEQELEALKTLAKNDTAAKPCASKGPTLKPTKTPASVVRFGTGDAEIDTLRMMWQWEKQRADRALDQVDFLEAECQLKVCAAAKALRQSSSIALPSPRLKRGSTLISDAGDSMILSEGRRGSLEPSRSASRRSKTDQLRVDRGSRRSTVFVPEEGIFRTVSQAEADAMAAKSTTSSVTSPTEGAASVPITPTDNDPMYRRTPTSQTSHTADSYPRPHTTAAHYPTITTTTKVPLRAEPTEEDGPTLAQRLMKLQRTPSRNGQSGEAGADGPSFDVNNPALTPTMTREEALQQIRERRGRARSVQRGASGSNSSAAPAAGGNSGAAAAATGGSGSGRTSAASGRASAASGRGSGGGSGSAGVRKVSGGAGAGEGRRKVSGEVPGSSAGVRRGMGGEERGREREVRREVSAPTTGGAAVKRGVSGVRRVRS
ncbi:hypothetical protein NEMBOFW57_004570 [Staphylotrichum longicolle]|uniref:Uncharacterized protein n=1 Tax=Staphylotrichum longicolle TaxID=669026 RepID=A0AAD4I5R3_9PEZI|nr:hypothetical protein NEMBOFW57_004570 [Staphylotrichum longicolle]